MQRHSDRFSLVTNCRERSPTPSLWPQSSIRSLANVVGGAHVLVSNSPPPTEQKLDITNSVATAASENYLEAFKIISLHMKR